MDMHSGGIGVCPSIETLCQGTQMWRCYRHRGGGGDIVLYTNVIRRNTRLVHLLYMLRNVKTERESTRERVVQCAIIKLTLYGTAVSAILLPTATDLDVCHFLLQFSEESIIP